MLTIPSEAAAAAWRPPSEWWGLSHLEDGSGSGLSSRLFNQEIGKYERTPEARSRGAARGRARRKRVLGSEVLTPVPPGAQDRSKGKEVPVKPTGGHLPAAKLRREHTLFGCGYIWSGILGAE